MKFSIRDLLWLTVAAALAVGWWIDRAQMAIPAADYRRLKAEEDEELKLRAEFYRALRGTPVSPADPKVEDPKLGPDGLRRVPGEKDYQFPAEYPLYYEPLRSNSVR